MKTTSAFLPTIIFSSLFLLFPISASAQTNQVEFYLDPDSATVNKDSSQEVKIMLDSGTQEITAGDVYLEYDSAKIQINQSNITKGEEDYDYGEGTCDFRLKGAVVDSSKVRFGFSCEDDQGVNRVFSGDVHVGSITFKALVDSGSTGLNLRFIPNATAGDCNAAKDGRDYLTGVVTINDVGNSALFTFSSSGSGETSHKECNSSNQCVSVSGSGTNECTTNSDCQDEEETHMECNSSKICVAISGSGTDKCTTNSDCASSSDPDTYLDCINNQCVSKTGTNSDHSACVGKYAGSYCSSSSGSSTSTGNSSSTITTTTSGGVGSTSKGATNSGVPYTASNPLLTVLSVVGGILLIAVAVVSF